MTVLEQIDQAQLTIDMNTLLGVFGFTATLKLSGWAAVSLLQRNSIEALQVMRGPGH
ncbi:hypothetical protein [Corynebacterium dentalis]|uniref:hypothetical protein n=1 Tax=Corynebacterium dentalis TaxID=2014528 RepID=UPI00289A01E4|nr:hypothetical protein [Corynebacterium dentalis]